MARNEEKQLGRLNRLHLKKLHDEIEKKNPKRPKLASLDTVEAIKQWIPSIKKDLDFCLQQLQVACYPERKIAEVNVRINQLQGEYKAYLRKLRQLDPSNKDIPWEERGYKDRKRAYQSSDSEQDCTEKRAYTEDEKQEDTLLEFKPINAPILNTDYSTVYGYHNDQVPCVIDIDEEAQNEPLEFNSKSPPCSKNVFLSESLETSKTCTLTSEPIIKRSSPERKLYIPYSDSDSDS